MIIGALAALVLGMVVLERRDAAFYAGESVGRNGISVRAKAMIMFARLINVRGCWTSEVRIRAAIAKDRQQGPALPPVDFARRFALENITQSGRPVYRVAPKAQSPTAHVFYLHGGGFVRSITSLHWEFVAKLVDRLGCEVVVPLYPLAPEHAVDDILEFLLRSYQAELARAPGFWTVMGDSAGASLVLSLAMQLRNLEATQPDRLVLMSPALDLSQDDAADSRNPSDPIIDSRALPILAGLYGPGLDSKEPRISPLYGRLDGLPNTVIFVGTREIVYPSVQRFMQAAQRAGMPAVLFEYPGMVHVWPLFPIPEAERAFSQIARALGPSWPDRRES
ncbi:alpha/beta hydrolase [Dyella sp. 2RAB6]|uniref:alpha/beta hydrolase n=1 Tax=Dyella sp. 2RAB6 TaxID=3232992 RepID=UPI003F8FB87D